jgi:hypothetical protein
MKRSTIIDLGAASAETRGGEGRYSDDIRNQLVPGLSRD